MLFSALDSLSKLHLDLPISITVVVVENNAVSSLSELVRQYDSDNPDIKFRYFHEGSPGVANARNAALLSPMMQMQTIWHLWMMTRSPMKIG